MANYEYYLHNSLCIETPVNSLKMESSNLCLLCLSACIFSGSILKHVWTNDINCSKAVFPVEVGITFKNVNQFSSSFIDSMALDSLCSGSRHLICFMIMDPSGPLSNYFSALATRNFIHCFLNSETSALVTRSFLPVSVMVSSVASSVFNLLWLHMLSFFVRSCSLRVVPEVHLFKTSDFIKSCRRFPIIK